MKASFSLNGYMLIGGEVATVDQINDIIAERDSALAQNAELVVKNRELSRLLNAAEKQTEQLTLIALGEINLRDRDAEVGRAGFVAGYMLCNDGSPLIKHNYQGFADKYAESIKAGKS